MNDLNLVETAADGTATTTSLVVANGTESQHASVIKLVRNNLQDFEDFGGVGFEIQPFETAGGTQSREVAILNREHAMLLMTYMRNTAIVRDFKKKLIKAFVELEKRAQQGSDLSELDEARIVQRAIQVQYQKIQELEARELENAPKVDYHDDFVADDDLLTFSTVASRLGIKESHLRKLLIDHKWIYKETRTRWSQSKKRKVTRYRYTECADKKGYFERNLHHDVPRFGGQVMYTLMITPAGAVPVSRAVRKWMGGQGELEVISGDAA